jgi:hypothetical protein
VIRPGDKVAWAMRGFNPHHPKDPSYYPLLVHLARTGQILRLKNRPGNVHDSKGAESVRSARTTRHPPAPKAVVPATHNNRRGRRPAHGGNRMHGLVNPYECERRDGVAPVS